MVDTDRFRQPFSTPRFEVAGVRIDAVQLPDAVDLLLSGGGRAVHLCNAYTLSLASNDPQLNELLNDDDLNLPDGMPLVWLARRLGLSHMQNRVYGPDLMELALEVGRNRGTKHYLYGSTPDVLEALQTQITYRWPGAVIVGAESPSFGPISDEELKRSIAKIDEADADVVWVGMGTPKQDQLVHRFASEGRHTYVAIGAAFDFIAGTKRQAPKWVQKSGLEWLYRLLAEPRRLLRRYTVGNLQFIWILLTRKFRLLPQ
jgi:N-acetylglucosaminyldiphosphoundecaprenol N-acetyl-beta-D-mannosaminyltransferase